jgi:uncharacterized protein
MKDTSLANPLKSFVPVEERSDGVYISVSREDSSKISIDAMIGALKNAYVMNFDAQRISEVFKHCRSAFEKIGPPFEYYNPTIEKYVEVGMTPLKGSMKLSSMCITDNCKPTVAGLLRCLENKGVKFGVKKEAVSGLLHNSQFDKETAIAEGRSPVAGKNAIIHLEVNIDHDFKPQEKNDGTVDFRNVNTITQVRAGQVIANKIPATKGEPGKSVSGDDLPAVPGNDVRFPSGKNTRVSDDGLCLLAEKSGFVYKDGEVIHVGDLLPIPKDVDFSVGNIKYTGDIQIKGNVLSGFTVETEGNIIINGQVESAKIISRNEGVEIQKGIIGKNETLISGKKKIHSEFAQETVLISEGVIVINKFCLHCDSTSDVFESKDSKSTVIGGHIRAYSRIEVNHVGNDKGIVTKLSLVDKNEASNKEKLKNLEILQKKLNDALEPIKKQLRTKAAILKNSGGATDRIADELKKWLNMYNEGTAKLKYVEKSILDIKEKLKNPVIVDGCIKITGNIYPGTELHFFGITKPIKSLMTNKVFRFLNGAIATEE